MSKDSLQIEIKINQHEYSQTCLPNPIPSSIFLLEADSNPFQQFHVFFFLILGLFLLHMQAYIYLCSLMYGSILKAQGCLLLLPLIYVCLQALKWPKSKQWEVNVHIKALG